MEKFGDFAIKYLKIPEKDLESIKSILELHGIFTKEHEISNEFAILAKKERFDENFSRKILTALEFFKLDWSRTRYPFIFKGKVTTPEEYYGEEKAQKALRTAEEILKLLKAYLKHSDVS